MPTKAELLRELKAGKRSEKRVWAEVRSLQIRREMIESQLEDLRFAEHGLKRFCKLAITESFVAELRRRFWGIADITLYTQPGFMRVTSLIDDRCTLKAGDTGHTSGGFPLALILEMRAAWVAEHGDAE